MRFKRSSLLAKIIILALVVFATVTLVQLQGQVTAKDAQAQALQAEIQGQKQENLRLQQAIDALDTEEGIEAVARQKLGMVARGEIVFCDVGQ